jgi:hypothetical protein
MLQTEGQVFFGRRGKAYDPRFAFAIFHRAVMGLILEKKAAIFHEKSSRRNQLSIEVSHPFAQKPANGWGTALFIPG